MVKNLPSPPKASDQLAVPLVSESVPQRRQNSGVSGRGRWERYGHPFLADCFFADVQLARMFQGCEKGQIHTCFLNMLLCGRWGNNR